MKEALNNTTVIIKYSTDRQNWRKLGKNGLKMIFRLLSFSNFKRKVKYMQNIANIIIYPDFFFTGQGEAACFISRRQAILYAFVLPVALLMLFNIFALGHTILHIVRTRKVTKSLKYIWFPFTRRAITHLPLFDLQYIS